MMISGDVERVLGASQLYVRGSITGCILPIIAKLSDNFLIVGDPAETGKFISALKTRFEVDRVSSRLQYSFEGFKIKITNEAIMTSMRQYWHCIQTLSMMATRRNQKNYMASTN